jgi:hypothetical protein
LTNPGQCDIIYTERGKNPEEKGDRKMANYRYYGQAQEELNTTLKGYNRVDNAFIELDTVVRRLQKVKKVYTNEVATLVAMREMINNILADIEENGKEVGNN